MPMAGERQQAVVPQGTEVPKATQTAEMIGEAASTSSTLCWEKAVKVRCHGSKA